MFQTFQRTRWTLLAAMASASLVMASTGGVTAMLPAIGAELGSTQTQIQWIADIYPVALAALLLPCGALLDRFGRRRGLLLGTVVMIGSLVWSAQAESSMELILGRGLSGVAGALMFPATLASVTAVMPEERRTLAVGLWASSVMAGGGYGLILGGLMVETVSWQSAFWVLAGITVACLLLSLVGIRETRDPEHAHLDPLGAALSCVAIATMIIGIVEMPVKGIEDPLVWGCLAVSAVCVAGFIAWELRVPRPLLDVRLLGDRMFGAAAVWILVMYGVAFGWFFLAFQYFAFVLGWGPLASTLGLLPMLIPLALFTPLGGLLAIRFGTRAVLTVSAVLLATAAVVAALAGDSRDFGWLSIGFVLFGIAGAGQAPATQAIVEALPRAKQGVASAVNDVSRELGAAMGIAIMGSAFTSGYLHSLDGQPQPVSEVVRDSPAAGMVAAQSSPDPAATVEIVREASVVGWEFGFIAAAAALVLCAAVVAVRAPNREAEALSRDLSHA